MIATECEKLRDLLRGLEKAKANQRTVESLNKRQEDDLNELCENTRASFESFEAMNKRNAIANIPDGGKAKNYVTDLRTALGEDPESITKGRGFTTMVKAMAKIAAALDEITEEGWKDYLARSKPKLDENQLAQASQIGDHRDSVRRLEALDSEAKKSERKPPANEEGFTAIEARWQEIRDLVSSLPSPTENPEIQKFLDAASSREGAPIELMTTDVMDWLEEQAMSKKFRIHQA